MNDAEMRAARREHAGLLAMHRSRTTGTVIGLYRARDARLDDDEGRAPYSTVCQDHGTICCHRTLRAARGHMAYVGWCEACHAGARNGPQ